MPEEVRMIARATTVSAAAIVMTKRGAPRPRTSGSPTNPLVTSRTSLRREDEFDRDQGP